MRYTFPLAFMANTFAVTALLIGLGLAGHQAMAAEVGVVQAATLALLYAFSANARSLILSKTSGVSAYAVMSGRLLLMAPLAAAAYWLSAGVAGAPPLFAIILIARRCIEWIGEVHLSEMERLGEQRIARQYVLLQSALLFGVLAWLIGDFPFPLLGLSLWAAVPLLFSVKFLTGLRREEGNPLRGALRKILPNLGSTAIIGITVYVFRLLILLVTSKEIAGDLFTAFAIGGAIGSIFANALGASIALHEQNSGRPHQPRFLRWTLSFSLLAGVCITAAAIGRLPILELTGKSYFFWQTTGLSMIAGVIMVHAQKIRFRLLQHDTEHDVFGPDVLMNILIFTAVPFAFYLFGQEALSGLYLASALLAYMFYFSARKEKLENMGQQVWPLSVEKTLRMTIAALLLLPLFFQIGQGVFHSESAVYDSGGRVMNLPIPLSALVCYSGIVLLGTYRRAFLSFSYIFMTCVLMIMSAIILTQNFPDQQQAKFLLLIQLLLPMFALVLGQVFEPKDVVNDDAYAKAFFWVLIVVVPVQLFYTWCAGHGYLSPEMGFFSVYQTLEYVPLIFVAAYILALFYLWDTARYNIGLSVLSLCMAVYVVASSSVLSCILFFLGLLVFAWIRMRRRSILPVVLLVLASAISWGYGRHEVSLMQQEAAYRAGKLAEQSAMTGIDQPEEPSAATLMDVRARVASRIQYWDYYLHGVTSGIKSLLLGAGSAPERRHYPSAHNYYLDFVYNFGLIAILPTLFLVGVTIRRMYRMRAEVLASPALLSLSLVVLFLVIIDNAAKVSMRQPYSGVFIFFLWGLLITKLSKLRARSANAAI